MISPKMNPRDMTLATCLLLLLSATLPAGTLAQSNYAEHGTNVEYIGNGLPDSATLDGKVTKLDDISPVIFLNRTKGILDCEGGIMSVELKFKEPFFGIAYADFDRHSACSVAGKGDLSYKLDIPLKGCGTIQDPQRVFTNNIVVRFHPGLEMEGDEVITIVCRYPTPITPIPPAPPLPIQVPESLPAPIIPPLKEFEILMIICAILFLSLLLLGIGCSYYCLKNRNVRVVRRRPFSSLSGSEITKLSGSTLGNISMFEGLKIPRAHATSMSGSEAALIVAEHSDTLPSDYPSESPSSLHSETEDIDVRSVHRSESSGSYENRAFIQDVIIHQKPPSDYSDSLSRSEAFIETVAIVPKPEPKFDVSVRVKRAAPPRPPSSTSSIETLRAQEQQLTTILERDASLSSDEQQASHQATFTYVPELHPAPTRPHQPPIYAKIRRRQQEIMREMDTASIPDNDNWSESEHLEYTHQRKPSLTSLNTLNTEMTDTRSMTEIVESNVMAPREPSIASSYPDDTLSEIDVPDTVIARKPELTTHLVDDVYLRTIRETKTFEDIERHTKEITSVHTKPKPPPTKWDVMIRNYPAPRDADEQSESGPEWDRYSSETDLGSERARSLYEGEDEVDRSALATIQEPPETKWDVLIRVLEPTSPVEETDDTDYLTDDDREKWRQIITTESTLRTLLTEATVREDYERISKDQRYEKLFEPQKWDVIIRVLAPPPDDSKPRGGGRYRKKSDFDARSRRSSLPPLYEYDSEGSSTRAPTSIGGPESIAARSRRTSRSSLRSDMDVRSMTEVMVDFAKSEAGDTMSDVSGPSYRGAGRAESDFLTDDMTSEDESTHGLIRSPSQPSLARSASEFTEQWVAEKEVLTRRYAAANVTERSSYVSSPEHSPRSSRSRSTVNSRRMLERSSTEILINTSVEQHDQDSWADTESEAAGEDLGRV